MKPTMKDVASLAGVSVATVSHVINGFSCVSEKTAQKVLDAVKRLEYQPNAAGRILKTGKKNLIGFIVPDIANDFFSAMIEAVEGALSKHGYRVIVCNTKENMKREIENLQLFFSGIVDALLIASTFEDFSSIQGFMPENFPVVFIDRLPAGCPHDSVIISSYQVMYQNVLRLIHKGHRKIGYITGLFRLSTSKERLRAYEDALTLAGFQKEMQHIKKGGSIANSSIQQANELLAAGCTALVIANNIMTLEVLAYLSAKNIKIGTDIEILGYNDNPALSSFLGNIQYITQPTQDMGHQAAELLIERLKHPQDQAKHLVLTCEPCQSKSLKHSI